MKVLLVSPDSVRIGDRHRKDLGDLDALVTSIEAVGLLHPIVLDGAGTLIAGERRLAAWRIARPGESIPAHVATGLDDAVAALRAERDENVCRKDFAPTEAVALGERIEALERPKAEERKGGRPRNAPETSGKLPEVSEPIDTPETVGKLPQVSGAPVEDRRTTAKAAKAVGMGRRTYEKAKAVVAAATDETLPEPVREAAREAAEAMDRTGRVDPAYQAVETAKVAEAMRPLDELLDGDPDLEASSFMREATKALVRSHALWAFDAERFGVLATENEAQAVRDHVKGAQRWVERMDRARSGLRVIEGGAG